MIERQFLPERPFAAQRMDEIDQLILDYEIQNNTKIMNLSRWEFSDQFYSSVLSLTTWPNEYSHTSYNYPWELGLPEKIKNKLNIPDNFDCIVLANTSQALTLLACLTSKLTDRHVIGNPSYWAMEENIRAFGGQPQTFSAHFQTPGLLEFQGNDIKTTVLWLTNPMFATGTMLPNRIIEYINQLDDNHILIFDEALNEPYNSLIKGIRRDLTSFFILSPHKHLNINGLKFSAILYPKKFHRFMVEYSDSLFGSLPSSALAAVQHFLSDNYDLVLAKHREWTTSANTQIETILKKYSRINLSDWHSGIYRSVYLPFIPDRHFSVDNNFTNLIAETNCAVIPGIYNKIPSEFGLSFRVNLSLNSAFYLSKIQDVMAHLDRQ